MNISLSEKPKTFVDRHLQAQSYGTSSPALRYTPELDISSLRHWSLSRFPYKLLYIEHDDQLGDIRMLQLRRDLPASLVWQPRGSAGEPKHRRSHRTRVPRLEGVFMAPPPRHSAGNTSAQRTCKSGSRMLERRAGASANSLSGMACSASPRHCLVSTDTRVHWHMEATYGCIACQSRSRNHERSALLYRHPRSRTESF